MDTSHTLILDTPREAAGACGLRTIALLEAARRARGRALLAVSGGNTPRIMFEWMAQQKVDWQGIEIFLVDERCFPPDHPQSNYRMLREALLDPARIPASQVHRVLGELAPEAAASAYEGTIRGVFRLASGELPVFDVIQRGMGGDAHTASLFPGEPAIADRTGLVAALWVEKMQQHRVTLLRGVLERARATLCLVTGSDKAEPLRRVFREPFDPLQYPSQISSPEMIWFLDRAAAAKLT